MGCRVAVTSSLSGLYASGKYFPVQAGSSGIVPAVRITTRALPTGGGGDGFRAVMLVARMAPFTSTIFAEMSALALRTGAINLGQGFPDTDGPASLLADAAANVTGGVNQYPPGIGIPALRMAVAEHQKRFYGLDVDPDHVLITTGATEAIAAAVLALCGPGDEVVTFQPYYDSYAATIALSGATLRAVAAAPAHLRLRPRRAARRVLPAHPRGAGQHPAQPDRRRVHPRAAHLHRRARRRVRRGGRDRRGLRAHGVRRASNTSRWRPCPGSPTAR